MKKKTKVWLILLSCILASIIIIYSCLAIFYKPNYAKSLDTTTTGTPFFIKEEGKTPYFIKKDKLGNIINTPFKIATTADLHLKSEISNLTLGVIENFIKKEKPDLFVLLGDIILSSSITMHQKLAEMFEHNNQYWAFTMGNHDGQDYEMTTYENRKKFFNELSSFQNKCVIFDEGGDDVFGFGNCAINIKNSSGQITQTLFFMDSNAGMNNEDRKIYKPNSDHSYDYIKQNQIDWYKQRLNEIKEENNNVMPKSLLFLHIPLPEYQTAYDLSKKKNSEAVLNYGNKFETICCSAYNSGFFDVIKSMNSTQAIVCGHDHNNDLNITYKGISLIYSQTMAYDSYCRRNNIKFKFLYFLNKNHFFFTDGITILMVKDDGNVDITAKYSQTSNVFDGLEKYFKLAKIKNTIN